MSKRIARLLSVAGGPIVAVGDPSRPTLTSSNAFSSRLEQELLGLLSERNGFYAFESALLLRSFSRRDEPFGIEQWNEPSLWKSNYRVDLSSSVFFAEDIFGVQFCIKDEVVSSFDPETAELKRIAVTLEDWARWILEDARARTGWPIAHFWQLRHGPIKPGVRLLPKTPFVLGGQFTIENLYELDDVEGMRFRASIANQLANCPDGAQVVLKIQRTN